jgi:hypothetical protein
MRARATLYALLLVVAGAAAVLSFAALRDLALRCGFSERLAWLLPVVVDAGAAAGSLVWLGGRAALAAQRFARSLAVGLLGLSVAANALDHWLAAYVRAPDWRVVVVVSAIAPAVLGAVVHLAVLVGRPLAVQPVDPEDEADRGFPDEDDIERWWATATPVQRAPGDDRARKLIEAGVGRRRLSRELGVSEYEARQLLERTRQQSAGRPEVSDLDQYESDGEPR